MKQTICLNMIVKNEADIIVHCLENLYKHIDYFVICDTGSTDNTVELIREFMKDKVEGVVLEHEWVDFSHNRNLALDAARAKCDYIYMHDADDTFTGTFPELSADAYFVPWRLGALDYGNVRLIKDTVDCKWKGALHEVLDLPCSYSTLDTCRVMCGRGGARNKNPNKYADDAEMLLKEQVKDPHNTRTAFYLANSYRDSEQKDKAVSAYLRRYMMGGWADEQYLSLVYASRIMHTQGINPVPTLNAALKVNGDRPEAYYALARWYAYTGDYRRACEVLDRPYKQCTGLFVEDLELYTKDLYALSLYYAGFKANAKTVWTELVQRGFCVERLEKNITYC